MSTKDTDTTVSEVEPDPSVDDQDGIEPTISAPSPTKSPAPLGNWEPNSPPAN
ncbi:hypothetical protein [Amycolatopsis palatopharyngis]|uniref:hypothetical protein n=1 Tax=Amycolatopsis palatopharyngis TaxID=187982 RepID=UPI0013BE959B|nr:hypothetical protein [Amycolatopsis palatopharyngis]